MKKQEKKQTTLEIILIGLAIYILLPTWDEIFIQPTFGLFLSQTFNTSFFQGVLFSVVIYRSIGIIILISALLIGGKMAYGHFKTKIKEKKSRYKLKRRKKQKS